MSAFDLPPATVAVWAAAGSGPATDPEIAAIAALTPHELPQDYTEFLRTHGFVSWRDVEQSLFVYPGGREGLGEMLRAGDMQFILRSPDFDIPQDMIPVMSDYSGHAILLMRVAPPAGAILHLYDDGPAVEIAPSFTKFINELTACQEPLFERWTGTPEVDATTGFTIAAETRAGWERFGDLVPEAETDLAEIEARLGQPLPEAMRLFLATYGAVMFSTDAPMSFDLPPGAGQESAGVAVVYSTIVLGRKLPSAPGAPLPFALGTGTARTEPELLIGLGPADAGVIYWRPDPGVPPVRVADDLRGLIASLHKERAADG